MIRVEAPPQEGRKGAARVEDDDVLAAYGVVYDRVLREHREGVGYVLLVDGYRDHPLHGCESRVDLTGEQEGYPVGFVVAGVGRAVVGPAEAGVPRDSTRPPGKASRNWPHDTTGAGMNVSCVPVSSPTIAPPVICCHHDWVCLSHITRSLLRRLP